MAFLDKHWKNSLISAIMITLLSATAARAQDVELPKLDLPGLSNYTPAERKIPLNDTQTRTLFLEARLTAESEPLDDGIVWRIFGTTKDADGKMPLIASVSSGGARIELPKGSYIVHAAFGRAGATSRITIADEARVESLVLNAGGLRLDASLPDGGSMRLNRLKFDIYEPIGDNAEARLILPDVPPGKTIRLNAGTYHIVSKYGHINAVTRADLRVEAGKITEATIEQRAAQVNLNLVRSASGFPLADTAWSIINKSGDMVRQDVGAVPSMILSAGEYTVIAKNKDKVYQKDIEVVAGRDRTIRIETKPENEILIND